MFTILISEQQCLIFIWEGDGFSHLVIQYAVSSVWAVFFLKMMVENMQTKTYKAEHFKHFPLLNSFL